MLRRGFLKNISAFVVGSVIAPNIAFRELGVRQEQVFLDGSLNCGRVIQIVRNKYLPELVKNIFDETPMLTMLNKKSSPMGEKIIQPIHYE